jgi:hypothetical protein
MGVVRLYDPERGDLAVVTSVGLPGVFLEQFGRVPVGVGTCGMAAVRGGPVVIEDVRPSRPTPRPASRRGSGSSAPTTARR